MAPAVSIIIATFGSDEWRTLAEARAWPSAVAQGNHQVILAHGKYSNLADVRNSAAGDATGGQLIFLDGDDELEPGYVDAMLAGTGDLRYPMMRFVRAPLTDPLPEAMAMAPRPLLTGNFMCIGTMLSRRLFDAAGGFFDEPAYEDWSLWIRCWILGAKYNLVPGAVYRAYHNPTGRNYVSNPVPLFHQIADRFRPLAIAKGLL